MSRLGYLARNPKRSLGALATVAVAASLTVGSGAYFADSSSSAQNSVDTGRVDVATYGSTSPTLTANECRSLTDEFVGAADTAAACSIEGTAAEEGTPTFKISEMVPGQQIHRQFKVTNHGDVPVALRLSLKKTGGSDLLAQNTRLDITRRPQPSGQENTTWQNVVADVAYPTALNVTNKVADAKGNYAGERIALEPGRSYVYTLTATLKYENVDQSAIENDAFSFDVDIDAKSLGTTGA